MPGVGGGDCRDSRFLLLSDRHRRTLLSPVTGETRPRPYDAIGRLAGLGYQGAEEIATSDVCVC